MKHLPLKEVHGALKELPEGEIFAVYEERPVNKSIYVLTATESETHTCLAVKIKGQMYSSQWLRASDPPEKKKDAMYQVLFIKKGGWYNTGETRFDELNLHKEPLFRCAWCGNETVEPKGACICRRLVA